MKKLVITLLCVFLSWSLMSCDGMKVNSETSEDFASTEISNKEEAPASDFEYEISKEGDGVYITKYIGSANYVIIPEHINGLPVVSIKGMSKNGIIQHGAFENCGIKTVKIPNSVTQIGINAFKNCKELVEIEIGENVEQILIGSFQDCVKLKNIDFHSTKLSMIGQSAFEGCICLSEIKFSKSLLKIDRKAFYNCSALLEVDLPDELVEIAPNTFENCLSLKTIVIPQKLDLFQSQAPAVYNVPSLERIILKEGREEINGYGFFDITSNVEIQIPKSVKKFSPAPFFIHGAAKIVFLGDCPILIEKKDFYGEPTIYYDPSTDGWDTCIWRHQYSLLPIE